MNHDDHNASTAAQDGKSAAHNGSGLLSERGESTDERPDGQHGSSQENESREGALTPESVEGDAGEEDVIDAILSELSEPRREQLSGILIGLSEASAWSGALPQPDAFYQYRPEDRERMMKWNDAGTSDESRRQDALVAARISEAKNGPRRAIWIVLICLALAAVSGFWKDNALLASVFLSPPVLMFLQNLLATVRQEPRQEK